MRVYRNLVYTRAAELHHQVSVCLLFIKNMIMDKIMITAGLMAMMALSACNSGNTGTNDRDHGTQEEELHDADDITLSEKQMRAVEISLGKIERKNIGNVARVTGVTALDPQYRASVTPLMDGVVSSIVVTDGNRVAKGQTVAWIENTGIVTMQKDYLQSLSGMEQAGRELERQKELAAQGAGVLKNLQQAEAAFRTARAAVLGTGRQLSQLGISTEGVKAGNIVSRFPVKAPIAGYVDNIKADIGSYADMQTSLMSIVDNDRMHCDINVFEKDIAGIRVGQKVSLMLTNRPGTDMTGEIYGLNSSFLDDTKAIVAHVRITEKPEELKLIPDMYLTGLVQLGRHETDAVPSGAVVSSGGRSYIFQLKNTEGDGEQKTYHFVRTEVTAGASELGYTQITPIGDIAAGATVVTANAFYIESMVGEHGEHNH